MLVMVWGGFRTRYPSSSSLPEVDAKSKGLGLDPGAPEVAQNTLFGRDGSIGDVTVQWTPEIRLHAQSPDHIAFQIESTPASSIGKSGPFRRILSDNIKVQSRGALGRGGNVIR